MTALVKYEAARAALQTPEEEHEVMERAAALWREFFGEEPFWLERQ